MLLQDYNLVGIQFVHILQLCFNSVQQFMFAFIRTGAIETHSYFLTFQKFLNVANLLIFSIF